MPEEIIRLYSMQDEELQTRAQSQKSFLQADLAQFTPLFPWITGAYLTSYQSDIDTAVAFPLDNTVMTDIKVLTSDVNASVTEGKAALDLLFKYSEIAYPGDKVRQRVFGQDMMERARQDQEKMAHLLDHANSFADKAPYKADLLAKGYTQVQVDALATIAGNIRSKNTLQENAIAERPVSRQDRITVHNTVFDRMRTVYTCAQVVFASDAARQQQYRVYPSSGPSMVSVEILVQRTGTGEPLPGITVNINSLGTNPSGVTGSNGIVTLNVGTNPPDLISIQVTEGSNAAISFEDLPLSPPSDPEQIVVSI